MPRDSAAPPPRRKRKQTPAPVFAVKPPPQPWAPRATPAQKQATIWAAEQFLPAWEYHRPKPPVPKPQVPFRATRFDLRPPPTGRAKARPVRQPAPTQDQRYHWAFAAPVSPVARKLLSDTMTPQRRREIEHRFTPPRPTQAEAIRGKSRAELEAILHQKLVRPPGPQRRGFGSGLLGDLAAVEDIVRGGEKAASTITKYGQDVGNLGLLGAQYVWELEKQGGAFGAAQRAVKKQRAKHEPPVWTQGGAQMHLGLPLETAASMAGKAIIATPLGVAAGVRHPARALDDLINQASGMTQITGAVLAAGQPGLTKSQRVGTLKKLAEEAWTQTLQQFGPHATLSDLWQGANKMPAFYALAGLAVLDPTLRVFTVGKYMAAGAELGDAIRWSEDPHLMGKLRTFTARPQEGKPFTVEKSWSRSPSMRGVQRIGDWFSRRLERVGGERFPVVRGFTETGRALREQKKIELRAVHRAKAQGHALWGEVQRYIDKHPEDAARLRWALEKPADIPEDEWLHAISADLERMLAEAKAGKPIETPTPAELKRLQRKVGRFRKQMDEVAQRKWTRRVAAVYDKTRELGFQMLSVEDELKRYRAQSRAIEADPTLSDAERATQQAFTDEHVKRLEAARKDLRDQYDSLTVDETPVPDSPARQQVVQLLNDLPHISPEQADTFMLMSDSAARAWGILHQRDPGEFYSDPAGFGINEIGMIAHHADVPADALLQTRPADAWDQAAAHNTEILSRNIPVETLRQMSRPEPRPYVDIQLPEETLRKNRERVGVPKPGETPEQAAARADAEILKRNPVNPQRVSTHVLADGTDLSGLVEIGRPNPEQWLERAWRVFSGDEKLIYDWLTWYETAHDILLGYVGGVEEKADQLMAGFIASQANASPSDGINAVLQVLWKDVHGEEIGDSEISAAVTGIKTALAGQPIESGFAAKLSDFADALARREFRTWVSERPEGGAVAPSDVHAIRDSGYITHKLAARAIERGYDVYYVASRDKKTGELLRPKNVPEAVTLVASRDEVPEGAVIVDSADGAGVIQYENIRRFYEDNAAYLNGLDNGRGFLGRNNWEAAHAQALGWGAIQRFWGAEPDTIEAALEANTLRYIGSAIGHPRRTLELTNDILDRSPIFAHADLRTVGNTVQWRAMVPKKLKTREAVPEDEVIARLLDEGPFTHVISIRAGQAVYREKGDTFMVTFRGEPDQIVAGVGRYLDELPELEQALSFPNPDGSITFALRSARNPEEKININPARLRRAQVAVDKSGYNVRYERTRAQVKVSSRVRAGLGPDDRRLGAFDEPGRLADRPEVSAAAGRGEVRGAPAAPGAARPGVPGRRTVHHAATAVDARSIGVSSGLSDAELADFNAAMRRQEKAAFADELTDLSGKRVATIRDPDGNIIAGGTVSDSGYIANLFSNQKGVGGFVFQRLVQEGGKFLDAFDGYLPARYAEDAGFREVGRMHFDERYAPEGWDYATMGRPDIVFMAKVDTAPATIPYHTAGYIDSYEIGQTMARQAADRGHVLHQTRQNAILGAMQYLETGGRNLYFTADADFSTVVHELFGHAAVQLKASHPEEFAAVERVIGRPLEAWTVDDHEQFARMFERYIADGRAPTPELVPAFRHGKAWMKSIYGGMSNLERPLPPAVRDLFDRYFGAYNDENIYRVAAIGTHLPEEARLAGAHTMWEFGSKELAAMRRRKDAAAYGPKMASIERKLKALDQKAGELGGFDQLDHADQEAIHTLYAQWYNLAGQKEIATADRVNALRRRLDEVEAALASPTHPGYEGALTALNALIDSREQILRTVYGGDFDKVFANRVDLMADWLVDKGMLTTADFERGSARYVHHAPEFGQPPRQINIPAAPLEGSVIGRADTARLELHRRNNLIRWQNGDIWADPKVVFEAWHNAQAFYFIHRLKEMMWDLGRPLGPTEPVPDNVMVIKHDSSPLSPLQRETMNASSPADAQLAVSALEGRDVQSIEQSLVDYAKNTFLENTSEMVPPPGALRIGKEFRVIDKRIVEALFRPLRGGAPLRALDLFNTLARWSLIYSNPAYIPTNFIGNTFFLLAQQGPLALKSLIESGMMLKNDRELATLVSGETGELPLISTVQYGRTRSAKTMGWREREKFALGLISYIPDRWPRMAAWVYEARRLGYRSREDMFKLLKANENSKLPADIKLARDRELVSERATEIMVNFDKMSDPERQWVTRALFIWPWIRGATAWPFYYAREFPLRTAVAMQLGEVAEKRRKGIMGNVSPYYRALYPIEKTGPFAEVVNAGPYSTTSTFEQSLEAIRGNILGVLEGQDLDKGDRIFDYLMPLYQFAIEYAANLSGYGQQKSSRDLLLDNLWSFVPMGSSIEQLVDPTKRSHVWKNRDAKAILERRMLRSDPLSRWAEHFAGLGGTPDVVNLPRMQAFKTQEKGTPTERVDQIVKEDRKQWEKENPNLPFPQALLAYAKIKINYEDRRDEVEKQISDSGDWVPKKIKGTPNYQKAPSLTSDFPVLDAQALYQTVEKFAPGQAKAVIGDTLDQWLRRFPRSQRDEAAKAYRDGLYNYFISPASSLANRYETAQ